MSTHSEKTQQKQVHSKHGSGHTPVYTLLLLSCLVMSDSLQPHRLQHIGLPCPSPSPGVCPRPLSPMTQCPLSPMDKLLSTESMMSSNHLVLCRPLLLLPSIFPSIRVFSNKLSLHIKWPKYWNFSFSTEAFELWWYRRLLDSEEIQPVHPKGNQS